MADRLLVRMSVFVILRNDKNEILLQQRANTGYLDGYWDFPSGHVEYGESIQDTAIRELKEEVGLTAHLKDLHLTHVDQYFLDRDYINFIFVATKWSGKPKIGEPEKCSGVKFFPINSLPEKCVNMVRAAQQSGFSDELTFSVTNRASYGLLMGTN